MGGSSRGKLVFKGEDEKQRKKKKKKNKHNKKERADDVGGDVGGDGAVAVAPSSPAGAATSAAAAPSTAPTVPTVRRGTGLITSSGTVVSGHDGTTRFAKEIGVGDAILSPGEEMRVVTMVLSDQSLNVSSAFAKNIGPAPQPFRYIPKPKTKDELLREELERKRKRDAYRDQERRDAFGTYDDAASTAAGGAAETAELVYREKTEHGSYRIKRVKVSDATVPGIGKGKGGITRTDLLELRTKKKSDKYC